MAEKGRRDRGEGLCYAGVTGDDVLAEQVWVRLFADTQPGGDQATLISAPSRTRCWRMLLSPGRRQDCSYSWKSRLSWRECDELLALRP